MNRMIAVALGMALISTPAFAMGSLKRDLPERPIDAPPASTVARDISKPMLIIGKCSNCTAEEFAFIRKAEDKMNEVVAGQCFQTRLSGEPLIQTNGLSAAQVVETLPHAGVQIDVEMYYTLKRVLGYTLPSAKKEWLNRRYMLSWNVCDLGSLLAHETSHKIGYGHDHQNTPRRKSSVPYTINRVFKSCCTK